MSSVIWRMVVGIENLRVNDAETLFSAAETAGIPLDEVKRGMTFKDGEWWIAVEITKKVSKQSRKEKVSSVADTREIRTRRVDRLARLYASIPASFDDRLDGVSPFDE